MLGLQSGWWTCWICSQGGGHAGFAVRVVDMLAVRVMDMDWTWLALAVRVGDELGFLLYKFDIVTLRFEVMLSES